MLTKSQRLLVSSFFHGMSDAFQEEDPDAAKTIIKDPPYLIGFKRGVDIRKDWDITPSLTVSDYIEVALEELDIYHP